MMVSRDGARLGPTGALDPRAGQLAGMAAAMVGKQDVAQRLCGSLQVDIEKTRRLLGWTPPLSLDEGLRRAAAGGMNCLPNDLTVRYAHLHTPPQRPRYALNLVKTRGMT